jgi:hypothetical protein
MPDPLPPSALRIPFTVVALDERVDLEAAPAVGTEVQRHPYGRVFDLAGGPRAYVLRFGAVVVEGDGGEARASEVARAIGRTPLPETRDTWTVVVSPDVPPPGTRMGWDQVVVNEATPARMDAIALLLAQSAALERYEREAERLLEDVGAIARELASAGRPPQGSKRMVQRVGQIAADRLELARWFYLVDRPEVTWEQPDVAALYDALFQNLELEQRHRAMLHKLDAASGGLATTLDLWHARWNHRLEWAIVLLILIDIVLVLLRVA